MEANLAGPGFEHVVLVNEADQPIGTVAKSEAHHGQTPLHRGFSVFLFDRLGRTLLQQRSYAKATWPGVWSNACCGHPQFDEAPLDGMSRRLGEELGLAGVDLHILLPDYRYRCSRDGIVENEFCPVAVGVVDDLPQPNRDEVHAIRWLPWADLLKEIDRENNYSEWCVEEARLLANDPAFRRFLSALGDARA